MKVIIGSLLGRGGGEDLFAECRRCGTTVDASVSTCSVCDGGEIVTYDIR